MLRVDLSAFRRKYLLFEAEIARKIPVIESDSKKGVNDPYHSERSILQLSLLL